MDNKKMTIKEIESLFASKCLSAAEVDCFREDERKAVGQVIRRWERAEQERARVDALYEYERSFEAEGRTCIAGVDEAGRGPLAGPVVVAAVIFPSGLFLPKINDSKKLSPKVRDELYDRIIAQAVAVERAIIDAATIDRVNIYQATVNGMYDAIFGLKPQPSQVLIDAVRLDRLPMPSLPLIKGDAKSASIAAASIIAKVERDRMMDEYDKLYPVYGFAQHKGYGTAQHVEALQKYGPCPIHRRSFEPVKSLCEG
ncbi:MAG: ribonuclease HII [Selenomonadaceae bacterium]